MLVRRDESPHRFSVRVRRIVKLVRALRKGWIKADRGAPPEEPPAYLLWQDDGLVAEKTANGALPRLDMLCDSRKQFL